MFSLIHLFSLLLVNQYSLPYSFGFLFCVCLNHVFLHFVLEMVCIIPLFYLVAGSKVKNGQQSIHEALMLREAIRSAGVLQCSARAEATEV